MAEFSRATLFALLPPAAAAGGLALAPLLGIFGIASCRPALLLSLLRRPSTYLLLLAAFAIWISCTALWSPYHNGIQALKFVLTLTTGLIFAAAAGIDERARRVTLAAVVAAVIVLSLLLIVEAFAGMPLNRAANPDAGADWQLAGNPGRGAAVLASIIWAPLGLLLMRRDWCVAIFLLFVGAVLTGQFGQTANLLAFSIGALACVAGFLAPRTALLTTTGTVSLWMIFAPFLTPALLSLLPANLPFSWESRTAIWRYVCGLVLERPLFGHGLDASRVDDQTLVVQGQTVGAIPLHPHSASLQVWFETGAIGALIAAGALVTGGWALSRAWADHRSGAAAASGSIAAIAIIANVSFGAWQEWWNATMLIAAAAVSGLGRHRYQEPANS